MDRVGLLGCVYIVHCGLQMIVVCSRAGACLTAIVAIVSGSTTCTLKVILPGSGFKTTTTALVLHTDAGSSAYTVPTDKDGKGVSLLIYCHSIL